MTDYYRSSFGGLQLWLNKLSTDRGRTQVVHELSSGDDYVVQDRGRVPQRARGTAMFDWMDGDAIEPLDRLRALQALVDEKPRILSHPVSGSFLARVAAFTEEVDERGVITAELEFIPVSAIAAVAPAAAGGIPATGQGAVQAAAAALAFELEDAGIDSTLPDDAIAAVNSWSDTDLIDPRTVITQTGSLTSQLGAQADELDGDIALWSAFKATVNLAEAVRTAAQAATALSAQNFAMLVGGPVALRAILASVYSAEEADFRYDEVLQLNDIANPAWIEPGTQLLLPLPTPSARSG